MLRTSIILASIVGSGHNSTVLHYSENSNAMKAGDVVVIDAAAEYSMYAADITRTLPVSGNSPLDKEKSTKLFSGLRRRPRLRSSPASPCFPAR